jgi:hypothetical protein
LDSLKFGKLLNAGARWAENVPVNVGLLLV